MNTIEQNSFEKLKKSFYSFLEKEIIIPKEIIEKSNFELITEEDKQKFGDLTCNIAMIAAKSLKSSPKIIAEKIIAGFKDNSIVKIDIAGPGFLNFFSTNEWHKKLATEIITKKDFFFKEGYKSNKKINVEFISANPTGPLHIGHGRNGIIGDLLSTLYNFLGDTAENEFYINDAGAQIKKLGQSFKIRCLQQLGEKVELEEDAYHGEYLIDFAKSAITEFGSDIKDKSATFFEDYAKDHMLEIQKQTLKNYGIEYSTWFSERQLHRNNEVEKAIEKLIKTGYTYEAEDALWFKSTAFGDDKDRVLRKRDGTLTYVAADIAYMLDKFNRGFDQLFMILGHDHHSYKVRLHAIMQALGLDPNRLTIILYQLVHIIKDGKPVRMSKRTGNMITLSDIIDEVGKNVSRFFFLNRKADAELEFDIDLALSKSNENPVFYIQYANVRTHSICKKAKEAGITAGSIFDQELSEIEKLIIKKICSLKDLLLNISKNHQTHLISYYSYELASLFHKYYNSHHVIIPGNQKQSEHRLKIVLLIQLTLELSFKIMGITPLKKM